MGHAKYAGVTRKSGRKSVWTGRLNFDEAALKAPLSWKSPKRIFVNSMSDLFHEAASDESIKKIWTAMRKAHWHTYQILTKRPERAASMLQGEGLPRLKNVWLGTSVENSEYLYRLDYLRNTPAEIRFVSFEPLIASVGDPDLRSVHWAIVGGESGPNARPMSEAWVDEIEKACRRDNAAFFFKQWGGTRKKKTGRTLRGRTWDEYPSFASLDLAG